MATRGTPPPAGGTTPAPTPPAAPVAGTPAPPATPAPRPEPSRPTFLDVDVDDGVQRMLTSGVVVMQYVVTVQVTDQKHNGITASVWHTGTGAVTTPSNGFLSFTFDVPVGGKALQVRLLGTTASDQFRLLGPKPPRPIIAPCSANASFWRRFLQGWSGNKE